MSSGDFPKPFIKKLSDGGFFYDRCWALLGNIEEFTGKRKEAFCNSSKKTIETALKLYTQLLREAPECLKM